MSKKIGMLSLVLSFLNLIAMVISPIRFGYISSFFNFFSFKSLEYVSFNFGDFDSFFFANTNIINIALSLLFVIGALVYKSSNYKNFTILRFIYSVIFFTMVLFLPLNLIYSYSRFFGLEINFYNYVPQGAPSVLDVILMLISYAYSIALIVITYKITKFFSSQLHVKYDEIDYGYSKSRTYVEAKMGKRFLHLLIDNTIFYTVFYTFFNRLIFYDFIGQFFSKMESEFGERFSLIILISICRIIYFLIFECLFKATPAKFLTQTKVMYYDGSQADTKSIIARTFSRLFPLESITFLFGYNLHDNWSSTAVFEEQLIDDNVVNE